MGMGAGRVGRDAGPGQLSQEHGFKSLQYHLPVFTVGSEHQRRGFW